MNPPAVHSQPSFRPPPLWRKPLLRNLSTNSKPWLAPGKARTPRASPCKFPFAPPPAAPLSWPRSTAKATKI